MGFFSMLEPSFEGNFIIHFGQEGIKAVLLSDNSIQDEFIIEVFRLLFDLLDL
jgi:hypothetical protein